MIRPRHAGAILALVVACALPSCDESAPPRDQWTIFIGTDATVPQIGDRLLVEIVDEAGEVCAACRRQFGASDPAAWPISFGVAPREDGARLGIRARLYRTAITGDDGLPGTERHIDAFAWLPEVSGPSEVGLELRMSCFGVLATVGESCDPTTGARRPAPELVPGTGVGEELPSPGSWELAGPTSCEDSAVAADEVCVGGGAFLLGAPHYLPFADQLIASPEQLVVLSRFALDVDEMTVGKLRPLVESGVVPAPVGPDESPFCTWSRGDDLPVNCYEWRWAQAACEALGKRLPTEAEWEYAASNLQLETDYPWLQASADPCAQAVVDQNRGACRPSGEPVGPIAGVAPLDVTLLGIRNMAGNVGEWVADVPSSYGSPDCWGESVTLRRDPLCTVSLAPASGLHVLRGGAWTDDPYALLASNRSGASQSSYGIGFRCARSLP